MPVGVREAITVTTRAVKEGEKLVKKAWSLMEAASEKQSPSDYLSPKAVRSIQGRKAE